MMLRSRVHGLGWLLLLLLLMAGGCRPSTDADSAPATSAPTPAAASSSPPEENTALGAPMVVIGDLALHAPSAHLFPGMGAVYLTVIDTGTRGDRLLRVSTPLAAATETHESIDDEGVMRMVGHPEGFAVPPGGQLILEPGGKHIMLIAPRVADPVAGIPLELVFEQAGSVEVTVPVAASPGSTDGDDSEGSGPNAALPALDAADNGSQEAAS